MMQATPTVMDRLRDETRDLHDAAEHHAFQRSLAKGEISRGAFAAYLGQMMLVHRALETELREASTASSAIGGVVREFQFQTPYLMADLAYFDVDCEAIRPLDATARFIEQVTGLAKRDPMRVLGMHYVLEGSNNGSKFIARGVSRGLGLSNGNGLCYLDPYGEDQVGNWQAFKADMLAQPFTEGDVESMLAGAKGMFRAIALISDDLAGVAAA